jgi:hypothetical protein
MLCSWFIFLRFVFFDILTIHLRFLVSQKVNWGFLLSITRCLGGSRMTTGKTSMRSDGRSVNVADFHIGPWHTMSWTPATSLWGCHYKSPRCTFVAWINQLHFPEVYCTFDVEAGWGEIDQHVRGRVPIGPWKARHEEENNLTRLSWCTWVWPMRCNLFGNSSTPLMQIMMIKDL